MLADGSCNRVEPCARPSGKDYAFTPAVDWKSWVTLFWESTSIQAAVKILADEITEAVALDAMDEDALHQVDITAFHTVVVAISDNFEAAALVTSSLKDLGIPHIICEANSERHRQILARIGAERVILPKEESGNQLAEELSTPGMLNRLHLTSDYSLIEVKVPPALVGKGIDVCEPYGVIVVLILRGEELILNPDQSARFTPEDILVLVGNKGSLAEFIVSQ